MSKNQYKEKLIIPAIRQYMGDWVYFSASMTMKDIYDRVSVAEEIHEGSALKEKIQRDLLDEKRAPNIKKYLEEQEQRFFNSFVIGVYGGVPQWYEIEIEGEWLPHSDEKIPERLEGALGLLMLEGDEQLFAIDGQHRVAGIRKAIDDGVDIADEEVSALFVGHETSVEGRRRTRRLFTTLNRYAKPVRKHEAITLDEDDVVAISTRRIIEDQKILKDRVALNKTKSIQTSDNKNFTSLVTVYDSLDVILRDRSKSNWEDFKKIRPKEKYINEYVDRSYRFYNLIYENFEDVRKYANEEIGGEIAQPYRNSESGGHLLFRPVGLILVAKVARYLMDDSGLELDEAITRISLVPTALDEKPWRGLLWDDANHRMITSRENQRAARRMTLFGLGGDLSRFRSMSNEEELRQELSGLYNRPEEEIDLPKYT